MLRDSYGMKHCSSAVYMIFESAIFPVNTSRVHNKSVEIFCVVLKPLQILGIRIQVTV